MKLQDAINVAGFEDIGLWLLCPLVALQHSKFQLVAFHRCRVHRLAENALGNPQGLRFVQAVPLFLLEQTRGRAVIHANARCLPA